MLRAVHTFRLVHVMLFVSAMAFLGARSSHVIVSCVLNPVQHSSTEVAVLMLDLRYVCLRAESTRTTYQIYNQRVNDKVQYETPNAMTAFLGKRWRAERNFWISFFAFTMWGCAHLASPPICQPIVYWRLFAAS